MLNNSLFSVSCDNMMICFEPFNKVKTSGFTGLFDENPSSPHESVTCGTTFSSNNLTIASAAFQSGCGLAFDWDIATP